MNIMRYTCLLTVALVPMVSWSESAFLPFAQKLVDRSIIKYQPIEANYEYDRSLLRQESVGIALKLAGITYPHNYQCRNDFLDVAQTEPNYWACLVVEAAVDAGLVSTNNHHFRPEAPTSRAEMLALLLEAGGIPLTGDVNAYSYDPDTNDWQKKVVATAMQHGIISRSNPFEPNRAITRGESFVIINNILIVMDHM